ncbi:TNF receptor-associated factor 6-like [Amblyomma americanum]
MPPAASQYTLVGFSPDLDWRPLSFVKPIQTKRVCSACGLVRRRTALLSCAHVLCDSCYEQCDQEGSHVCPLDGHEWHKEEQVYWRDPPPERLLRQQVKCWNAKHGCGTVVAASMLSEHFQRECRHHSARCPKCSASVLCSDVCAHLRSDCATPSTPLAPESVHQLNNTEDAALSTSFQRVMEEQADEITAHIGRLVTDVQHNGDRLNEMSYGINTFKEVIRGELMQATSRIEESMTTVVREIASDNERLKEHLITWNDYLLSQVVSMKKMIKDDWVAATKEIYDNCSQTLASILETKAETLGNREKTLDHIKTLLPRDEPRGEHVIFDVKGVKSLEADALKKDGARYDSEQACLCGYCMSLGVIFMKDSESVHLHMRMRLQKGDSDDAVEWPFQHKIRMGFIHPGEGVVRCYVEIKPRRESESVQKPTTSSNKAFCLALPSFNLRALRNYGFVFEDTLRIKWEVLP